MLDKIDEDGSGVIEFDEFVKMMTAKMGERESKEEIKRAFRLFDIDETVSLQINSICCLVLLLHSCGLQELMCHVLELLRAWFGRSMDICRERLSSKSVVFRLAKAW
jgi:hypothetical protein